MIDNLEVAQLLLSKKNKLVLDVLRVPTNFQPTTNTVASIAQEDFGAQGKTVATMMVNLESYGASFSPSLFAALSQSSEKHLTDTYKWLMPLVKKSTGAHKTFEPMYPNFPEQVIEANLYELVVNAYMHYLGDWVGLRIMPAYQKEERMVLLDETKPRVIHLGTQEDVKKLFVDLVNANASISESDKAGVETLFNYFKSNGQLPEVFSSLNIVQKETLALVSTLVLESSENFQELMGAQFKTTTDVLRLATSMSGGDISLAQPTKFKNFKRQERRVLMQLVENILESGNKSVIYENLSQYREEWIRLSEKLHPGEYQAKYPEFCKQLADLRSGVKADNLMGKVDLALQKKDGKRAADLLSERPGVFARQLYNVLSHSKAVDHQYITYSFEKVAGDISTPVLLQVFNHFKQEAQSQNNTRVRTFLPKGVVSKAFVQEEKSSTLNAETCQLVENTCRQALESRFAQLPSLGNTYIDEKLKDVHAPFAMRSASGALDTLPRGSQLPLDEDSKVTRMFLWWNETEKNEKGKVVKNIGRVDVDLSVVALDKDFNYLTQCSFTDLRGTGLYHSGDITSAPNGACEFIEVNYAELPANYAYIAMFINSYTEHNYCDMPECFAGWMERQKPQSGEVFDPRTVKNKLDLTSDSTFVMPMILDVENRKVIWTDLAMKKSAGWNAVQRNSKTITHMVKGMVHLNKPTLYDLFDMHVNARGTRVEKIEDANTIFTLERGDKHISAYDYENIAAEFMADAEPSINLNEINLPKNKVKVRR